MQQRDVPGRVSTGCIRQNFSDENSVINPLEPWSRAEVPDGRNSSGAVRDEVVLSEDRVGGNDVGEALDQLLDRYASRTGAVPEVEQVVVDS